MNLHGETSISLDAESLEALARRVAEIVGVDPRPEPYMTVKEAAQYLACSERRIYDLTSQRRIPFVKDGSRTLLKASDLDAAFDRVEAKR